MKETFAHGAAKQLKNKKRFNMEYMEQQMQELMDAEMEKNNQTEIDLTNGGAAYIRLTCNEITKTINFTEDGKLMINYDVDKNNNIVGVEVIN